MMQTRQKLKEAYQAEFIATVERAEKQIILARHGLRLLQLLDDTPVVPGNTRPRYENASQARQILNDAEDDLKDWRLPEGLLSTEGSEDGNFTTAGTSTPRQTQRQGSPKSADGGSVVSDAQNGGGSVAKGKTAEIGA
jgi:hypothetical protein